MPDLGDKLKQERKKRSLTQADMAVKLGMKRSTYSLYESGKREPNIDSLQEIASKLEITLDELVGWEKDKTVEENIINSPVVAQMMIDTIKKGSEGKVFQISFNTNNYSPDELLKILEYSEFIKSKRNKTE